MTERPIEFPKPKEIEPKGIPFRCPVCNGFGTLGYARKQCHGCEGKGYVLVPKKEAEKDGS